MGQLRITLPRPHLCKGGDKVPNKNDDNWIMIETPDPPPHGIALEWFEAIEYLLLGQTILLNAYNETGCVASEEVSLHPFPTGKIITAHFVADLLERKYGSFAFQYIGQRSLDDVVNGLGSCCIRHVWPLLEKFGIPPYIENKLQGKKDKPIRDVLNKDEAVDKWLIRNILSKCSGGYYKDEFEAYWFMGRALAEVLLDKYIPGTNKDDEFEFFNPDGLGIEYEYESDVPKYLAKGYDEFVAYYRKGRIHSVMLVPGVTGRYSLEEGEKRLEHAKELLRSQAEKVCV